jgi:MFS family permease
VTTNRRLPREIWVLVAAAFVIALGFGIVAPALPQYARTFNVGVTAASVVVSSFAFMRLVFAPASAKFVDRFGERPIYTAGVLIVAASTGACALAVNYPQLLIFRGLGGIGSTLFTVSAMGLLIRISPPEQRGRVSGLYGSAFLLGNILGPVFGSALVGFGLRAPFVVYTVALVIAAAVVFFALRRSHLAAPEQQAPQVLSLKSALRRADYRAVLTANFAIGAIILGVRVAMVPLFVIDALHRSAAVAGVSLAIFAVGNCAVQLGAGHLSDRVGRRPFIIAGLALCGAATIAMGASDNLAVFMAASVAAGAGAGLANPAQQAALADVVGPRARGGPVIAAFQMIGDVGGALGPVVAGILAENLSYTVAFAASGAVMLLAALLWLPVRPPAKAATSAG